jgi:hypothetical protein
MIPFILAAVGGYLIGNSFGDEINSKIPKFADGGAIRYKDMTKADWEEFFIESKKEAVDNETFIKYYNKYKLLTKPHVYNALEKSKNFEDFYTRLNHYGYYGIDSNVPMMANK